MKFNLPRAAGTRCLIERLCDLAMQDTDLYWGYIGIMEKKIETTII